MEEEFVANQERLKPQEENTEEEGSKVDDLRGSPLNVGNELIDDNQAIVSSSIGEHYVGILRFVDKDQLQPGCSILLHNKVLYVVGLLQDEVDPMVSVMNVEKAPMELYADIGGLDEHIQEIKEAVELPLTHPELYEDIGIKPPKGVILYGEPGTCKTLLAKAVANSTSATFLRVVGSEPKLVRELFRVADDLSPSIVFVDEIDAVGAKRYDAHSGGEREIQRTMLELLNQLDGFDSRGDVKVILATNKIESLDHTLLRPGRNDRKIEFPLPDTKTRRQIHTSRMTFSDEVNLEEFVMTKDEFYGADIKAICTEAGLLALRERRMEGTPGGLNRQPPSDQNNDGGKKEKKFEHPAPPVHVGRKQGKQRGTEAASRIPTVKPLTKCKLRLLKLDRIKDYLLMEEEFMANQERLKPQEERTEEEGSKVVDLRGSPLNVGNLEELIDDKHAIVSSSSIGEHYVGILSFVDKDQLEPGCSILLHNKVLSVVGLLQDEVDPMVSVMKVEKAPLESYADIGGLDAQIQEIKEAVEFPLTHPELYEDIGIKPPKGVILYGEPGTGKTLLAKVCASTSSTSVMALCDEKFVLMAADSVLCKYGVPYDYNKKKLFDVTRTVVAAGSGTSKYIKYVKDKFCEEGKCKDILQRHLSGAENLEKIADIFVRVVNFELLGLPVDFSLEVNLLRFLVAGFVRNTRGIYVINFSVAAKKFVATASLDDRFACIGSGSKSMIPYHREHPMPNQWSESEAAQYCTNCLSKAFVDDYPNSGGYIYMRVICGSEGLSALMVLEEVIADDGTITYEAR